MRLMFSGEIGLGKHDDAITSRRKGQNTVGDIRSHDPRAERQ